jgi:hypothetical protein
MQIMIAKIIDRLGDWNPQLFRELKSRLSGTPLTAAVLFSILFQLFLWCNIVLLENASKASVVNVFNFLNWLLPSLLILGATYTIVGDLHREHRQGTLDFIRLTPQSARSLFLGKILGVPSLMYAIVLSIVPLHFILGLVAGANPLLMLAWYLTIGSIGYLFATITILYALAGGKYAILLTLLFSLPLSTTIAIYNIRLNTAIDNSSGGTDRFLSWFGIPIFNNFFALSGFVSGTLLLISYWLWITIDRKYINPVSTAFKKEDSYWMNIQFQLWLLGFALPLAIENNESSDNGNFYLLVGFYSISAVWIFCTVPLILPTRHSVREWSNDLDNLVTGKHRSAWKSAIIRDLIWHDRSPILVAMAINLAISAVVWGLCSSIFITDRELAIKCLCGILIASILTLIQTVIITFVSLRSKVKNIGAIPLIILMSWIPLASGFLATIDPSSRDIGLGLMLFSPFAWMGVTQVSIFNIGLIALGQIGILAGFTKLLANKVAKLTNSNKTSLDRQNQLAIGRS